MRQRLSIILFSFLLLSVVGGMVWTSEWFEQATPSQDASWSPTTIVEQGLLQTAQNLLPLQVHRDGGAGSGAMAERVQRELLGER
jgi:hypothetical protein